MRSVTRTVLYGLLLLVLILASRPILTVSGAPASVPVADVLSPYWRPNVSRWADEIQQVSLKYQIDPDLIAAVVLAESHGDPNAISRVGAVGLMGIMPVEAGFAWRPTTESLKDPVTNLDWGTAILADILRQAGGDVATALAAYNGGWTQISKRVAPDLRQRGT